MKKLLEEIIHHVFLIELRETQFCNSALDFLEERKHYILRIIPFCEKSQGKSKDVTRKFDQFSSSKKNISVK